ncbi:MAG: hypothetical protein ACXWCA_06975 [Kaistella sp.]
MKTIFKFSLPVFIVFSLISCNERLEGDEIQHTEPVKIDSVKIAQDTMDIYSIQSIKTYSQYSSQCEGFYGYDYQHTAPLERKIVSYKFKTSANCGELATRTSQINFRPQEAGTYLFRFWTGKDAGGTNTWLERTIVVE